MSFQHIASSSAFDPFAFAAAHGFNPQPDPPGRTLRPAGGIDAMSLAAAHGFNPQPDPPGRTLMPSIFEHYAL